LNTKHELIVINCSIIRLTIAFRTPRTTYSLPLPRPRATQLAASTIRTKALTPTSHIPTLATIVSLTLNGVLPLIRGLINMAPIATTHAIILMEILRATPINVIIIEKAYMATVIETSLETITIKTITTPKAETASHPTMIMTYKCKGQRPNQLIHTKEVGLTTLKGRLIESLNAELVVAGQWRKIKTNLITERCPDTKVAVLLDKDFSLVIKAEIEGNIIGTTINREIIEQVAIRIEIKVVDTRLTIDKDRAITMTDSRGMTGSTSPLQPTLSWLLRRPPLTTGQRVLPLGSTTSP
jgi:hypothetical protein